MSNLIITIISIALVAVLAIAGIFYGGAAYQNAQAKAYAVAIADQATQINNAIVQWTSDHGGASFLAAMDEPGCCGNNGMNAGWNSPSNIINQLVPNYMQTMNSPVPNDFAGLDKNGVPSPTRWEISGSDYQANILPNTFATYGYFIWLTAIHPITNQAVQICNQIAIMARGPSALPVNTGANVDISPFVAGENPLLDCSWSPAVSLGYTSLRQCVGSVFCNIFIAAKVNSSF